MKFFTKLNLLTTTLLFSAAGSTAYASTYTALKQTDEGPVTKIILDWSDPFLYPVEAFLTCFVFIVIVCVIKDFKYLYKPAEPKPEGVVTYDEMLKGKMPGDITEPQASIAAGLANVIQSDPTFSYVNFLNQTEKLYNKSIQARSSLQWGGAKFTIPFNLCLKMQKFQKLKSNKYKPITAELIEIQSYNTGAEKAAVRFTGLSELVTPKGIKEMLEEETWLFERFKGVKSLPDTDMTICPSCKTDEAPDMDGKCPKCEKNVLDGKYGWVLSVTDKNTKASLSSYKFPNLDSRKSGLEKTVMQKDLRLGLSNIQANDPSFSEENLKAFAADSLKEYYICLLGDLGRFENRCTDRFFRKTAAVRKLAMEFYLDKTIAKIVITAAKTARVLPDFAYNIVTFRIWGKMSLNVNGKEDLTTASTFSDYVTVLKQVGNLNAPWLVCNIESDEDYIP